MLLIQLLPENSNQLRIGERRYEIIQKGVLSFDDRLVPVLFFCGRLLAVSNVEGRGVALEMVLVD